MKIYNQIFKRLVCVDAYLTRIGGPRSTIGKHQLDTTYYIDFEKEDGKDKIIVTETQTNRVDMIINITGPPTMIMLLPKEQFGDKFEQVQHPSYKATIKLLTNELKSGQIKFAEIPESIGNISKWQIDLRFSDTNGGQLQNLHYVFNSYPLVTRYTNKPDYLKYTKESYCEECKQLHSICEVRHDDIINDMLEYDEANEDYFDHDSSHDDLEKTQSYEDWLRGEFGEDAGTAYWNLD